MKKIKDDIDLLGLILENAGIGPANEEERYFELPNGRILKVGPANTPYGAVIVSPKYIAILREAASRINEGRTVVFRYEYDNTVLCLGFSVEGDS